MQHSSSFFKVWLDQSGVMQIHVSVKLLVQLYRGQENKVFGILRYDLNQATILELDNSWEAFQYFDGFCFDAFV